MAGRRKIGLGLRATPATRALLNLRAEARGQSLQQLFDDLVELQLPPAEGHTRIEVPLEHKQLCLILTELLRRGGPEAMMFAGLLRLMKKHLLDPPEKQP